MEWSGKMGGMQVTIWERGWGLSWLNGKVKVKTGRTLSRWEDEKAEKCLVHGGVVYKNF